MIDLLKFWGQPSALKDCTLSRIVTWIVCDVISTWLSVRSANRSLHETENHSLDDGELVYVRHGFPNGDVATKRPLTVEFKIFHANAEGQWVSPGR